MAEATDAQGHESGESATPSTKKARSAKQVRKKSRGSSKATAARKRTARPYPASSFEEALALAEAIHQHAAGERVRRLTLLKQMNRSPTSSATKMLITNSGKYGITFGSYAAEWLALKETGKHATAPDTPPREKLQAQFQLAIEGIKPFKYLYDQYKGKKLPSQDVMKDVLRESKIAVDDEQECIDTFIVNAKYLGILQTIAGSETLLPIDHVLDEVGNADQPPPAPALKRQQIAVETQKVVTVGNGVDWSRTCFYIAPIGEENTEIRKHSDLFLGSLVEPALKDFGLDVVRADKITEPGMITSQVIEHIMRARLVIADLSHHNPNVFYEMALRHARKLPIVQITRKQDRLPFDVNQVRTVVIDTTDIYTLVPKLETYRSEIATQVRNALNDADAPTNPLSVFFPGFHVSLPDGKAQA